MQSWARTCLGSVIKEWGHRHRRAFWYAMLALFIGGVLGILLVGGFIYLVCRAILRPLRAC